MEMETAHEVSRPAIPHKRQYQEGQDLNVVQISHPGVQEEGRIDGNVNEPSFKRVRGTEWPLKNDARPIGVRTVQDGYNPSRRSGSNSPRHRNRMGRPSKFLEGSLNDKPSSKPPDVFLGEEDLMEQYAKNQGAGDRDLDAMDRPNLDKARPSSMFRFGRLSRAVASALNPSTVWQGLNGIWKEKDVSNPSDNASVLEERKARAADAYVELKQNGFKGVRSFNATEPLQDLSNIDGSVWRGSQRNSFRDSAIDLEEFQMIPHGQDVGANRMEDLNSKTKSEHLASHPKHPTSRRVSSLNVFPQPLQCAKRVQSQSHLPMARVVGESPQPEMSKVLAQIRSVDPDSARSLRQQASKKDLSKQQKLSKRVSDLESKLQHARRELEQSMKDAPPVPDVPIHHGRKSFVPGALPSLPSERLLNSHGSLTAIGSVQASHGMDSLPKSQDCVASPVPENFNDSPVSPSAQLQDELFGSMSKESKSAQAHSNLFSSDPLANPGSQYVASALIAAGEASVARRRQARSRTSSRTPSGSSSKDSSLKAQGLVPPYNTPYNSPAQNESSVSVIPTVDSQTTIAPRTRSSSPFLGRPATSGVVGTRSKSSSSKRVITPVSTMLPSAKKRRVTFLLDPDTPAKDTPLQKKTSRAPLEEKPVPQQKFETKRGGMKATDNKPLPDIQNEDFEWDEDVF